MSEIHILQLKIQYKNSGFDVVPKCGKSRRNSRKIRQTVGIAIYIWPKMLKKEGHYVRD